MKNNKNLKAILLGVILMVLAVAGATYAYFTATISDGDKGSSVIIQTGTLRLVYTDTEYINVSGVLPGDSYSKVVTVTNEGNVPVYYHLVWIELMNQLTTRNDLTMEISCTSNTDTCDGLSNTVVSESGDMIPIIYNVEIGMLETHTYTITIHFNETGSNQNDNQGKIISGKIGIIEARDLAVNLYGYVYDENGDPLSSTIVELHSDPVSVVTDANGRYEFESIPLGTHTAYIKTSDKTSTISTTSLSLTQGTSTNINDTNITIVPSRQTIGININIDPIDPILSLTLPTSTLKSRYGSFNSNYYAVSSLITSITIDNQINIPGDASSTWSVSEDGNSTVMAYIKSDGVSGYQLHIQGKGGVYAPTNSYSIFSGFSKVTTINGLENLNTSNVTNMSYFFQGCSSLTSLDLTTFNTIKATNTSWMFQGCTKLSNINISSFDTSEVNNMEYMFADIGNWESVASLNLDLTTFDTSKVTDMSDIFRSSLGIKSINVSNWNLSSNTSMYQMFYSLRNLETLNVTGMKTSTVTNMYQAFRYLDKMTSLIGINTLDTGNVTDMRGIFGYTSAITSLDLSNWDTSKVTEYMTGCFEYMTGLKNLNISGWDFSGVTSLSYLFGYTDNIESINVTNANTISITDMSYMFYQCTKLSTLIGIETLDTSNVTNVQWMFSYLTSLTSLNVNSFDTSKMTNMFAMFYNCNQLSSLNLANWDTSNVINMSLMFSGCTSLTSISFTNWNTSKVTNMSSMFYNCSSLTTINLNSFNTSSVTNIGSMFYNCSSLTTLYLNNAVFNEGITYLSVTEWTPPNNYTYGCIVFSNVPSSITIHVKDSTAQTFINTLLTESSIVGGTVTIG